MTRRILLLLALVAVGLLVAGCNATGGGYIPSETGEGKATFAFKAKCTNTTTTDEFGNELGIGVVKGQLQYNDRPADVKFHAELSGNVIIGDSSTPCEDFDEDENTDIFLGDYRVSGGPNQPAEGTVRLEVTDAGEPGTGINGDEVTISLFFGRYNGYTNSGFVQGGNVQVR